ncbi:MAG: metal-dependent hydrolase [Patescibacteria group bacterium]|nr:metal-dependent hydrolase [Patescibacteria group bacterium]
MVLPGHLAGGYLAAKALLAAAHASFTPSQTAALLAIGTLAGELPDIDLAFFYVAHVIRKDGTKDSHRDHITHAPAFWLAVSLVIAAAGYAAGSSFVAFIGWIVLAGTWSHFILDSIEYGIRWLWPFSDKRFCLREVPEAQIDGVKGSLTYYWRYIADRRHLGRVTFYAEIAVTAAAIAVLCA